MVANTRFTAPLTRRGKTKFATIKWYNLCRQIIQSQTCYPLNESGPKSELMVTGNNIKSMVKNIKGLNKDQTRTLIPN